MFTGKVLHSSISSVLAVTAILLVFCASGPRAQDEAGVDFMFHEIGLGYGLYHNRFIDDVISPAVYTASSPAYEIFYHLIDKVGGLAISFSVAPYTAKLRDGVSGDSLHLYYDGDPYSYPRSMYQLDAVRIELGLAAWVRVAEFQGGKSSLFLGLDMSFYGETMKGYDRWSRDMAWEKDKSRLSGFSMGASGRLERRFRESDRLSIDLHLAAFSITARPPYYSPFQTWDDVDPDTWSNIHFMLPHAHLRWSAGFTYVFRLRERLGLEACYRFRHDRVTEPRHLRYISHTLSLGVMFVIKDRI